MTAYDINAPPNGLRELMRASRHKKIPVYDRTLDNVVGLVYAKVLFLTRTSRSANLCSRSASCPS